MPQYAETIFEEFDTDTNNHGTTFDKIDYKTPRDSVPSLTY